jgi:hypothetical protein
MALDKIRIGMAAGRTTLAAALAASALFGLAGCNGTTGFDANANLAALPANATALSFVDVIAPQPDIGRRFGEALAGEARRRGFTVLPQGGNAPARQVKAWLDAYPVEGGKVAYSWVVQTSPDGRLRGERVNGAATGTTTPATAWSGLDEETLRKLAARSIDDLARVMQRDGAQSE